MERKLNKVTTENTNKKLFVIFKRCSKASNIIRLPMINQRLQYTSFTEGDGLELTPGDIVHTPKQNQLLIVHTSECDPSNLFEIEKSSFDVSYVMAKGENSLRILDNVKVEQRVIAGVKCYVINKRKFSYTDIKDAIRVLNCSESIVDQVYVDEKDGGVYMPTYFHSLLGTLKADLFDELIEN